MKILLVNYTDVGGGAALAAFRLVNELNQHNGVTALLGVAEKKSVSPFVFELPKKRISKIKKIVFKLLNILKRIFDKIFSSVLNLFKFRTTNKIFHSTNFKSIIDVDFINKSDFDVVNLHWINHDTISIKDISKIKKPIVWTMHDSWPCCGAEHHPNIIENDTRFITGYFKNNKPRSTKGPDICRKVFNLKKKYLMDKNIIFTAPSNWETNILKSSFLFNRNECFTIPNIIDKNFIFKNEKNLIRKIFSIPQNKKIIGFGASYDIDNPKSMKRSFYLLDAIKKLQSENSDEYFLVIFGPAGTDFTKHLNIPYFATGYISSPEILSTIYNSLDVFIMPSLIENLPTTCLESIFCGVPVVAFKDAGGAVDIIEHKKNGYLANYLDAEDLVNGIKYCFNNLETLSKFALEKAKNDFDKNKIIKDFMKVYDYAISLT